MSLNDIYDLFEESTFENFPIKRCIHKYKKCEDYRYSKMWYTCILISSGSKGEFLIMNLRPVVKKESDGSILYGWLDKNDFLYDNIGSSFDMTHEKVIAFKENDYDLKEEFTHELWKR